MTNTIGNSKTVNKSEIAAVAYQMWETAGYPPGRDLQFWLDAETQLTAAAKARAVTPATHQSTADSKQSTAAKAASMQPGPVRPTSAKPQQKVPMF